MVGGIHRTPFPHHPPTMGMPVVLTGTLRAVASDVGSGSCRCLRRYQSTGGRVEGAPESGAAAKRRGVGAGERGPAVCAAKRGSDSANAMAWSRAMDGAKRGPQERLLPSPANPPRPANHPPCTLLTLKLKLTLTLLCAFSPGLPTAVRHTPPSRGSLRHRAGSWNGRSRCASAPTSASTLRSGTCSRLQHPAATAGPRR
jgi:hypothetical protein